MTFQPRRHPKETVIPPRLPPLQDVGGGLIASLAPGEHGSPARWTLAGVTFAGVRADRAQHAAARAGLRARARRSGTARPAGIAPGGAACTWSSARERAQMRDAAALGNASMEHRCRRARPRGGTAMRRRPARDARPLAATAVKCASSSPGWCEKRRGVRATIRRRRDGPTDPARPESNDSCSRSSATKVRDLPSTSSAFRRSAGDPVLPFRARRTNGRSKHLPVTSHCQSASGRYSVRSKRIRGVEN